MLSYGEDRGSLDAPEAAGDFEGVPGSGKRSWASREVQARVAIRGLEPDVLRDHAPLERCDGQQQVEMNRPVLRDDAWANFDAICKPGRLEGSCLDEAQIIPGREGVDHEEAHEQRDVAVALMGPLS